LPVELAPLRDALDRYGSVAYFLSVSGDGRPHAVELEVSWVETGELVVHPGNSTAANVQVRPLVSLVWPPTERGGYSLIVDAAVVTVASAGRGDNTVVLAPTSAVEHRRGRSDDPDSRAHGSDCVRVFSTPPAESASAGVEGRD
jgi:hypothetical protein